MSATSSREAMQPGEDISPDSILWRVAGERRTLLMVPSVAILQAMVPAIGAGVKQHSDIFNDVWGRIERSGGPIEQSIYGPDAQFTARHIYEEIHKHIGGIDDQGRRYHAKAPETFWNAHATFHWMYERTIDEYTQWDLNISGRQQLYEETSALWRRYSVPEKYKKSPRPPNYFAFKDWWHHDFEPQLEMTDAAAWGLDLALQEKIDCLPFVNEKIWDLGLGLGFKKMVRLVAIGGLPETVREHFDIPFSRMDKLALGGIQAAARTLGGSELLPPEKRYSPIARAAFSKAGVELPR